MGYASKSKWQNSQNYVYEGTDYETIMRFAPVQEKEEFLMASFIGTGNWACGFVGDARVNALTSTSSGKLALTLATTAEAEQVYVNKGDIQNWIPRNKLIGEFVFDIGAVPASTAVTGVVGLAGAYNAAPDSIAQSAWFRFDGSGAITVETDDGTSEASKVATGTTLTAGTRMVGRIDFSNPSDVKFYIDGSRVASGTTFSFAAASQIALQPHIQLVKASSTWSGALNIDAVYLTQNRDAS